MAAERIITCKNADGAEIVFTEKEFNPFLLAKANGIYDSDYNVYMSNNTLVDGAEYQGSVMSRRNISLVLKDIANFDENRELIDVIFPQDSLGILTVEDGTHKRQIEYYVESVTSTATPHSRLTTISLLCPNPHFYDTYDTKVYISNVISNFEWPHEFLEEKEEFSYVNEKKLRTIINDSAEENIGLTITFTCTGDVTNPKLVKIETAEWLAVGTEDKPFEMKAGDRLIFTTTTGNKNVIVIRDGVTTYINEYLTDNSKFIQLTRGRNTFGFRADANVDYITVEISYRYKYSRA